jgi:hypothetical protein
MGGPGSLEINATRLRLRINQNDNEFVFHLLGLFEYLGIVGATLLIYKRSGNSTTSYQFSTYILPIFTELHNSGIYGKMVRTSNSFLRILLIV